MATALSSCGGGGRSVLVGSDNGDNVITGTSGNDYIEVNKQNSIVTGNGGNDTFVFSDAASSSSTITDLSTGDVVITATPISATNVKNFVANSQTLIEWGIVLDIYPDDTGSFIDVSLINSNSGGQVNFRGGKGVDTLIGSKTQNNFYVSEAGIANSDTMDGGDDLDTIGLSHGSHTFSTDNNIRNIEYIRLSSFSQHPVSLDISAQTENFTIYGGSGIDTIISGSGDDIISGGAGDDIITGGAGSDTITGGTGSDTFVFLQSDERLESLSFKDAFIIWNLEDLYRLSRKDEEVTTELRKMFAKYGSGMSIGRNHNLKGSSGAHVIIGTNAFYQKINGKMVGSTILDWLSKKSNKNFVVPSLKSKKRDEVHERLSFINNPINSGPTVIISGDGDCNGHKTFTTYLEKKKFNWVYINHCAGRLRKGNRINRINYSSLSNDVRVIDILNTIEHVKTKGWIGEKLFLVGFAQGASAVNAIVDEKSLKRIASKYGHPFEYAYHILSAVSYYPFCQVQRISKSPFLPHLVQLAEKDGFDEPFTGCEEKKSRSFKNLEIVMYENAHHGFDRKHYEGKKALRGKTKFGSPYLIEYDKKASNESLKKLENFLNLSDQSLLSEAFIGRSFINRKNIQRTLAQGDFYKGKIDGLWGGKTKAAIEKYAKTVGKEGHLKSKRLIKKLFDDLS